VNEHTLFQRWRCDIFSAMNISRSVLLLGLLYCGAQAQAQTMLHLTFAVGPPPNGKIYGTAAEQAATTLSVVDGGQVVLQRKTGRDYRLQGAEQNWSWTQVQQVSTNQTYIAVTPRTRDGSVTVDVAYSNTQGDKSTAYSSTVSGELGSWIPLIGGSITSKNGSTKVHSAGDISQQLSLKVEQ
jgi:hypothetical protein